MSIQRFIAAIGLSVLVAACSDDDGGGLDVPTTNNPQLTGPNMTLMSIGSPAPGIYEPGETMSFEFSVAARNVTESHIDVNFFLIEESKASQLEDNEEAETYDLGDFLIEEVLEGETTYSAEFIIPNELVNDGASGDFLIVGYIDAREILADDVNLFDNRSRGYANGDLATYGSITLDDEHHHDFIIHKVEVGEGFILLPEPAPEDIAELDAQDAIEADVIGFIDATKLGAGVISAEVSAEIIVDGVTFTAHLWQEEEDIYGDTMEIVFPNNFEEHYFPWDIGINGQLEHAMLDAYDPSNPDGNTLTLRFTIIDTSPDVEERDDNNVLEIEVPYAFFQQPEVFGEETETPVATASMPRFNAAPSTTGAPNPTFYNSNATLSLTKSFAQTYGDRSKFAIGLDIGTDNQLAASTLSAEFNSSGSFNIYIFNNSASLLSAHAEGFASGSTLGAGYDVGVTILGLSVLDESDSVADRLQKSWDLSWEEEQTLFTARFVILIVPLSVDAGISGSVGFGAGVGFDNLVLTATGTVFEAGISAYAEAAINLLIASGGVGGSFLIIEEGFSIVGTADLTDGINGNITLGVDIENELKAIQGDIYLFVRYPVYKFCCKVKQKEGRLTIYDTGALYDKTWTLFSDSRTLSF